MKKTFLKPAVMALLPAAALTLAGCWTPPNANVQPKGKPGLIQEGIVVPSDKDPAIVQAIDTSLRTITLKVPEGFTNTYQAVAGVKNFDQIKVGSQVEATVTEELAIYVLDNGRLPDGATAGSLGVNAKVLQVEPSYRLLTLQYPNGQSEIVKPGLNTRMELMSPGDSVVVRPKELTDVSVEKP